MAALIKIDHSFTSAMAERSNTIRFCSRCGEPAETPPRAEAHRAQPRVCQLCGMGLLLRCLREALPGAGAAFLVVTGELRVSAVSQSAEGVLGEEGDLLGTPLGDLFESPLGEEQLGRAAGQAALRSREPVVLPVRAMVQRARAAGMLAARISTCGPPRAALVTVEPSGFARS
jgi:PAS domain-containing protein